MKQETFCSLPFSEIFLGADGGIKPCCSMRGDLGNINQSTLVDILNGTIAQSVKTSIINGEWHPNCSQCQELESLGGRTERQGTLIDFDRFKNYAATDFTLEKLDLRWSNTCNLSCNYCYEYFSSQWANIKGIKVNANKPSAEDSIFSFIENNKDKISNINLLGGEPLLQKPNIKLLNLVPDSYYYILTNLSTEIEGNKLAEQLLSNPKVSWGISFETVGKRFEYVRNGADWNRLVHNLRLLNHHKVPNIDVHPLYCIYSAFNLCEFYEFLEGEGYFNNIYWQLLQNIKGLDIFRSPKSLKIKAVSELELCISRYEDKFNMDLLKNIHKKVVDSLGDQQEYTTMEHAKWLEELNGQIPNKKSSFIELWPEIYQEIINLQYNNDTV
jgi:sulfatase maturation enzyme AslB (radical SAM superfamily)